MRANVAAAHHITAPHSSMLAHITAPHSSIKIQIGTLIPVIKTKAVMSLMRSVMRERGCLRVPVRAAAACQEAVVFYVCHAVPKVTCMHYAVFGFCTVQLAS